MRTYKILSSRLFAIFGNPVSHSKSPLIHNAAFKSLSLPDCYARVLLEDGNTLKKTFLSLGLSGANITVPFKENAFEACDFLDDYAKNIGAVNTIALRDGKLHGFNTDAPGFMASLDGFVPKNVLILGAGGTARAIAYALKTENINVVIANRSTPRLKFFTGRGFNVCTFDALDAKLGYDLIVNTTSAGLTSEDELPCAKEMLDVLFENAVMVYDCIYKETAFLKRAKEASIKSKDGLDMLVWQAFFAFEKFNDKKFEIDLVDVMKEAVR